MGAEEGEAVFGKGFVFAEHDVEDAVVPSRLRVAGGG